ncbi:MAG: hypothetical protein EBS34_12810 [Flavobacteriales bacterium]|nr:hypothetical protein [Flavobacteriales bacterium]
MIIIPILKYLLIGTALMFLIDIANDFLASTKQEIENKERIFFTILWPIMIAVITFIAIKEATKNK